MASDRRFNDITRNLHTVARELESLAVFLRELADQTAVAVRIVDPPLDDAPQHIEALHQAALALVDLPAADIRKHAPKVAREHGLPLYAVAIHAQHMRAERKRYARRCQTIEMFKHLANGKSLKDASEAVGISEATGRRLRDAWRNQGLPRDPVPRRLPPLEKREPMAPRHLPRLSNPKFWT